MVSPINLEYSLDKTTWNNYDMTNKPTISVPAGSSIYLRGVNTRVTFNDYLHFAFSLDQNFSVGGDIRTLLNYQSVNTITYIPSYAFCRCFVEVDNSGMPQETKITSCTWDMSYITEVYNYGFAYCFAYCKSLTIAPDFSRITSIGSYAFKSCFENCTNLTKVIAPNIATWNTTQFDHWLYNVASSGVVRKPANLEIPTGSMSGVPNGWSTKSYYQL